MLDADACDGFALYGLALEYKAEGDLEIAKPLLQRAVGLENPEVYAYYQLAEVCIGLHEMDEARTAIEDGLTIAREQGHQKAASELAALLDFLD